MIDINTLELVLSEKSADIVKKQNKYTFITKQSVNKIGIKQFFKKEHQVDVLSVNSMNYAGKVRRRGKMQGQDNSFKKVIITLKQGQELKEYKDLF